MTGPIPQHHHEEQLSDIHSNNNQSAMFLSPSSNASSSSNMMMTSFSSPFPQSSGANSNTAANNNNTAGSKATPVIEFNVRWDPKIIRSELNTACVILSQRCLKLAAKWAAEQLIGLQHHFENNVTSDKQINNKSNDNTTTIDSTTNKDKKNSNVVSIPIQAQEFLSTDAFESSNLLYAKSLFELGEYLHAASVLSQKSSTATNNANHNHNILIMNPPLPELSNFGIFLRAYSLYLAGERRKEEDYIELQSEAQKKQNNMNIPNSANTSSANTNNGNNNQEKNGNANNASNNNHNSSSFSRNPFLIQLAEELLDAYETQKLDPFGLYIFGMVLKEAQACNLPLSSKKKKKNHINANNNQDRFISSPTQQSQSDSYYYYPPAYSILVQSVIAFPYNWSAWLDLADVSLKDPQVEKCLETDLLPALGNHYMYHFFCAHLMSAHQAHDDALMLYERLMEPTTTSTTGATQTNLERNQNNNHNSSSLVLFQSPYILGKLGIIYYHLRQFQQSKLYFHQLFLHHPYRLDDLDVYSNVLYVEEDRITLSQLAHNAIKIEKYRPETCCIIGNYYSLRQQRSKAVLYFQRALKLDRYYMSAWTLMGHEYVEMKNTAAAMESYRRAVHLSPNDYRAWYGLGQTYEFLNMPLYALYYYRKAVNLRPFDSRMWCAIGLCYLALHRVTDSIRCYERAVYQGDTEGIATQKLASLYRKEGDIEKAAQCYLRHLELRYLITNPHLPNNTMATVMTASTKSQQQQQRHSQEESKQHHHHPHTMTPNNNSARRGGQEHHVAQGGGGGGVNLDTIVQQILVEAPEAEALLYLASYHKRHGEYDTAALFCSRLLEYPGPEKEEAKALLRELRSRKAAAAQQRGGSGAMHSTNASNNQSYSSGTNHHATPGATLHPYPSIRNNNRGGQQQQQHLEGIVTSSLEPSQRQLLSSTPGAWSSSSMMEEGKDESSFEFSP